MLKWTVMNKRIDNNAEGFTSPTNIQIKSAEKPKRRRSCTNRRSSTSRRSSTFKRHSLNLKQDKENRFTSTPIKSEEFHQSEALRDVSNITPKDTNSKIKKCTRGSTKLFSPKHVKYKKKKRCLDPLHTQEFCMTSNYFKAFETVDSHIQADECYQNIYEGTSSTPRRIPDTYAPTLPTFAMEYSPCALRTTHSLFTLNHEKRVPPILSHITVDEDHPPHKKPKIDHVNDFLNQIAFVPSPEDKGDADTKNIKVSPLVRRLLDLRFSKKDVHDDSSYINELSLDELVNVILDNSSEAKRESPNTSIAVHFDGQAKAQELENELNETREENIFNTKQEKTFSDKNSSDSGFRSNSDHSHNRESCRLPDVINCDKTIINLDGTFNERCVDDVRPRKRSSSLNESDLINKRPNLEQRSQDDDTFTLKRQKCIRRRRLTDDDAKVPGWTPQKLMDEIDINTTFCIVDDNINDNSFDSSISEKRSVDNSNKKGLDLLETPLSNMKRTRRCLMFDSPISENASFQNSVPNISGSMDLEIRHKSDEILLTVFRCNNLSRSNGKAVNSYIKVSLEDRVGDGRRRERGCLQRTAVQSESTRPTFNHTFRLSVCARKGDLCKKLYIEVWHRDRTRRRSEFLGCMSFIVKALIKKDVKGTFYLLPQSSGRCQNVPMTIDHHHQQPPINSDHCRTFGDSPATMCESQSSVEEVTTTVASAIGSSDDFENDPRKSGSKALTEQQKLADENLFLRYLELDPMEGPEAIPAALQRKATGNKNGRTPFTTTKKLTRQPRTGFGFSVVWTHPPRIERVEKGLPADKAGIHPGDYIIFVDKHNVVMMPEIDILNLIRSYGNQLTLEIFRRNATRNGSVPSVQRITSAESTTGLPAPSITMQRRPSTLCSTTNTPSMDYNRKKLQLPQIAFNAEKAANNVDDARKKAMYQLISKEQQYATGLQFAITRFVSALAERKDLITPREHKILFQNSDELLRITEDILEHLVQDESEPQLHLLARAYHSKLGELSSAYKKYCSGIKKSDCILASKTKNSNSDFVRFLQVPAVPRRRPDITAFIHKPLEHFRDVLKLFIVILSHTKPNYEDYPVITQIVHDLQVSYREITSEGGMMEPIGEGRPLLSVQDLESRLVFTKCKPFVLSKPGRHWIFGGDLSRIEGRNIRQYWTLLFSDILLFAKVSRDRVLFIFEEPIPIAHITDLVFNVRKKVNEFRITVEPGGKSASSPTVHCGPDLTRTPRKNPNRKCIVLRAPTAELKAVWQNLLQRQIFHVNAGMDGSSFSSPLESPEAPITSSVVTLQSADSLSIRRQNMRTVTEAEKSDSQKQIDELIEHKCKQLGKSISNHKGGAIHLEQWMKGQLGDIQNDAITPEEESSEFEVWSEEMLRQRSEELQIMINQKNLTRNDSLRCETRLEEINISESEHSPSRSTTSESQVTVRSSPVVPETISVCRQCHRTCLTNQNGGTAFFSNNNSDRFLAKRDDDNDNDSDWRPLVLMGFSAIDHVRNFIRSDPFASPLPKISIVPPTPDLCNRNSQGEDIYKEVNCNCSNENMFSTNENDNSPDSPQTEDQPYHSLNSSNLTLRRYGTVSSLERVGSDEIEEAEEANDNSSDDDVFEEEVEEEKGYYNEAFSHSSIRSWTARAGSFVADKMAFFEKLGEDYKAGSKFFERYLRTTEIQVNGDDAQEEETSGATSGEDVWGTPTSGGELDDPLSSPNFDGRRSPNDGSLSSNDDNTELMMDELLMTPPVTSSAIRGLLPRRTLEPLMEEEYSDTYTSSSSSSSREDETDPSRSPEQGKGTGNAADVCSTAAEDPATKGAKSSEKFGTPKPEAESNSCNSTPLPRIHRSDSYRHIIEAEDDNPTFFTRLKPTLRCVNIERIPRSKGVKLLEFFNMKRERKIHESFAETGMINMCKEDFFVDLPSAYAEKPPSPKMLKDKQIDRRFWKQLNKRRGQKPLQLSA